MIEDALTFIGTLDNASGQICQMKDGKPDLLLFEFGCTNCSEVAGKNADEYGDALVRVVNMAHALERHRAIVSEVLQGVFEELRDGAEFENITVAIAARIELRWLDLSKELAL
jgi:putative lipoic acid-binding regulatory protein